MKNMQNGRSMIEMLGVLAIIGVLSVGGLAGYSKAVERHRINETIYQVNYIAHNTRDLFKSQRTYEGLSSTVSYAQNTSMSSTSYANRKLADKTKIFPPSLSGANYVNLFGGLIFFYSNGRFASGDSKAFIIDFRSIPKSACIEIATRDWPSMGLVAMRVRGTRIEGSSLNDTHEGSCNTQVTQGDALVCAADLPMTLPQATKACDKEDNNYIFWKFY